jgi:3-dehydroquinate synthase
MTETTQQACRSVKVDLGERSYEIRIGKSVFEEAGKHISALLPKARILIVSDENVSGLYLSQLQNNLDLADIEHKSIILPAGESTKSWEPLQKIVHTALEYRFERGDAILAFGGGVIGDLAGFASAIIKRGMAFIQMPTSLLAQVDSSVGGKTGINAFEGKNLIGAFHQPALVLADTTILDTLPKREFCAGYAEVAKYGLINNETFFSWLEDNHHAIFAGGPERDQAIAESCQAKANIVAEDELENGRRALLNLGHTFGHALEAYAKYDPKKIIHGEGVAIGMVMAFRFSHKLGLSSEKDTARIINHLKTVGLPTKLSDLSMEIPTSDVLMNLIAQDKKVKRGKLTFILAKGIGKSFVANDVNPDDVKEFLDQVLKEAKTS